MLSDPSEGGTQRENHQASKNWVDRNVGVEGVDEGLGRTSRVS